MHPVPQCRPRPSLGATRVPSREDVDVGASHTASLRAPCETPIVSRACVGVNQRASSGFETCTDYKRTKKGSLISGIKRHVHTLPRLSCSGSASGSSGSPMRGKAAKRCATHALVVARAAPPCLSGRLALPTSWPTWLGVGLGLLLRLGFGLGLGLGLAGLGLGSGPGLGGYV